MKLVTKPDDIKIALDDINPIKIAVAYIGADWNKYLKKTSQDTEIILSPTIGSNPIAILEMAEKIGYENIFFLDNLHAKFYLGLNSALLGSCNLSNNGIGGGLYEAALVLEDSKLIDKLNIEFDEYKKLAQKEYPDKKSKLAQIKKLTKLWSLANRLRILNDDQPNCKIEDYIFGESKNFHLAWATVNYKVKVKKDKLYSEDSFEDYITLVESDAKTISSNEWVLRYSFKDEKIVDIDWLYVDVVLSDRVNDKNAPEYSLLAGQLNDKNRRELTEPFSLTEETISTIIEILNTTNFPELTPPEDGYWSIPKSAVTKRFVETLKSEIRKNKP